jgi:hypothetical protein
MLLLIFAALATCSAMAQAQTPFPAPLPGDDPSQTCRNEFLPLRAEAERRGQSLKAAGDRHAAADEACKLIKDFIAAEVKMLKYAEIKGAECGIPPGILDQLRAGHKRSEDMRVRICTAAEQKARWPEGVVNSDFGDPVLFPRR